MNACGIIPVIREAPSVIYRVAEDMSSCNRGCCIQIGSLGGLPKELRPASREGVEITVQKW